MGPGLGASLDSINLAGAVSGGEQIRVPGPDAPSPAGGTDAEEGPGPLSLNQADASALQGLPGVGPVLAERIVAFREANGPFEQIEDLLDVPGIGEAKLAAMRDLVAVP